MGDHVVTPIDDLAIDFPACLAADFPRELPLADRVVDRVLKAIDATTSFGPLEDRSPGLRGNDWSNYLRCSEARMVHAANALSRKGITGGRVLDYGAYFGNFALLFRDLGFEVDAVDAYASYLPALAPIVDLLGQSGVRTLDFAETGRDLTGLPAGAFDVVLCMGVIEHAPHTPRLLLEALNRVVKVGGVLVIDTPNLAHLYNRQKLARGDAIMTPLTSQYHATIPFEGHHREFTVEEVVWMVQQLGHEPLVAELFNYSTYGQVVLKSRDVTNHRRMVMDPTLREIILVVSRKLADANANATAFDWRHVYEDPEHYWARRAPQQVVPEPPEALLAIEPLLIELQQSVETRDHEITVRDGMLAARQVEFVREVEKRDAELSALRDELGAVMRAFAATPSERLKRLVRRWTPGRQ